MLCKNCKHLKSVRTGYISHISHRSFCKIAPGDGYEGTGLGVYPWYDKPHPKCPLKNKKVG